VLHWVRFVFFASLITLGVGLYQGDTLPPVTELLAGLEDEPVQEAARREPFQTTVGGITYRINPLYRYRLYGLVVSKHESDAFWDRAHKAWGDHLNVADLCVVWGSNAFSGIYQRLKFSSGQWTCYWQGSAMEDWERFSPYKISNNHMLADRRDILKTLRKVRVGDQVYFEGYLAEYGHGNFSRGTSITRTDTGNHACETVYTEQLSILKHGPGIWRLVRWISAVALILSICAWFLMPMHYHIHAGRG
jgi:hypothetical protein